MAKNKLSRKDIEKVFPPKDKNEAIEQSERYEKEYEISKKELDEFLRKLEELSKKFSEI